MHCTAIFNRFVFRDFSRYWEASRPRAHSRVNFVSMNIEKAKGLKVLNMAKSLPRKVKVGFRVAMASQPYYFR